VIQAASAFTWTGAFAVDLRAALNVLIEDVVFEAQAASISNPTDANHCGVAIANNVHMSRVEIRDYRSAGANKMWGLRQTGGGNNINLVDVNVITNDKGAYYQNLQNLKQTRGYYGNSISGYNVQIAQTPANRNSLVTFSQTIFDEAEAADIPTYLRAAARDLKFTDCIFYAGDSAATIYDESTDPKFVNCKLMPFGTHTGAQAYQKETSGTTAHFTNCRLGASTGTAVVAVAAGTTVVAVDCTWGTGNSPSGTGKVVVLDHDGSGNLRYRNDPTVTTAQTILKAVATAAVGAAATDAASTQTLANNLRTALIALGLVSA
jgi:hypothetical protein